MTDSLGLGPLFATAREPVPLDQIAARIARLDDDSPPVDEIIGMLDRMIDDECDGVDEVDELMTLVFGTLGFRGNSQQYHDPANSYLHRVLERRLGIPISLSVVVIEIGRRLGIDLMPVGMPGHFLVATGGTEPCWFDPMAGGRRLPEPEARAFFSALMPGQVFHPSFLFPIEPDAVAMRMLNNLRAIAQQRGQLGRVARILGTQIELPNAPLSLHVDVARLAASRGDYPEAIRAFERLATLDEAKAQRYRAAARRLEANFN